MSDEIYHLRRLLHLQHAQLHALHLFAAAKIADLSGTDRTATLKHIEQMTQKLYSDSIAELAKTSPLVAKDMDIRPHLPADAQLDWFLALRSFPPPDSGEKN